MDIWLWISDLPDSPEWASSSSPFVYELASSSPSHGEPQKIQLRAEKMSSRSGSDTANWVTFSIHIEGFEPHTRQKTLWVSDTYPLLSEKPFLPLVIQLIQEIVDRSPGSVNASICPRSQVQKLKPDPVSWILETHSPESFSGFFALIFLTRLFWLCAFDAPTAVGSLYFKSFLEPNLELMARESHAPVVKAFLLRSGTDVEQSLARAVGYIVAKCLILREMHVGPVPLPPPPYNLGLGYAAEAHGLWVMKSYAPVWAMKPTHPNPNPKTNRYPLLIGAKESALRYTLAHQQLESVVQLEYTVRFCEDHIQVSTRVDNLRFHVAMLGYNNKNDDDMEYSDEVYFPSRIRVWVGPEVGSNYVTSLTLGKSTGNVDREVETQRMVKGNFGKTKIPKVKATSSTSTRTTTRSWRWDQDAEGNAAVYDGILHDAGAEVYAVQAAAAGKEGEMRGRYAGGERAFTKGKGLVVAGDECGAEVRWRVGKEMEGSVLKWRIGSEVWVSYRPVSETTTSFYETRCMEWRDEVDLPLMAAN